MLLMPLAYESAEWGRRAAAAARNAELLYIYKLFYYIYIYIYIYIS